ncbi:MAG TPA: helix-turn-helix domain-containing protein [Candidatus Limnocylindrales bacterium]
MASPSGHRAYDSRARRERAAATRRAILDAAEDEFGRSGYVATSIVAIARSAGVAPETVYASFRNKRGVLEALVGRAIAGDDEPVALLERPWVASLAAEPDRDRRIGILAREGAAILARRAGIDEMVAQAAGADAAAAELLETGRRERWAGQRRLLELVLGPRSGARDPDLDLDRAADGLFAIGSPEVYRLLVAGRGWTHNEFEAWYASAIRSLVIGGSGLPRGG